MPTRRILARAVALLLCALGASAPARAGVISAFDNPGDTAGWVVDRYAPATFASGTPGGGRNGVLTLGISSADGETGRPGAFGSSFYNTQGRSTGLPAGTTSLFVDLYAKSGFGASRYAGLWGVAVNGANSVSAYPIVEYANGGFRTWNGLGWDVVGPFAADQWYELGFTFDGTQFQYLINGQATGTVLNSPTSVGLSNVILQGHNTATGATYTAFFDNLSTTTSTPEPATLLTLGGLALGVGVRRLRRKSAAA